MKLKKIMNRTSNIVFVIAVIIIVLWSAVLLLRDYDDDVKIGLIVQLLITKIEKDEAVIVKVNDKELICYNDGELHKISISNEKFKQGQKILIYTENKRDYKFWERNRMVVDLWIAKGVPHYSGIKKIKVIEEQSKIEIPDWVLIYCYNSLDKVHFEIEELTPKGMTLTITDNNEIPYNYEKYDEEGSYELSKWQKTIKGISLRKTKNNENESYITDNGIVFKKKFDWTDKCEELEPRKLFF